MNIGNNIISNINANTGNCPCKKACNVGLKFFNAGIYFSKFDKLLIAEITVMITPQNNIPA